MLVTEKVPNDEEPLRRLPFISEQLFQAFKEYALKVERSPIVVNSLFSLPGCICNKFHVKKYSMKGNSLIPYDAQ